MSGCCGSDAGKEWPVVSALACLPRTTLADCGTGAGLDCLDIPSPIPFCAINCRDDKRLCFFTGGLRSASTGSGTDFE